jgi:hypothetical protein
MKRIILFIAAITALTAVACVPAVQNGQQRPDTARKDDARQQSQSDTDAHTRYSAGSGQTFLDTLNQGKEIALAPDDLPKLEVTPPITIVAAPAQSNQGGADGGSGGDGGGAAETRFRIQILAASQADMVRREKLNAEKKLNLPVFMVSEQSQFKLYAGDFATRAEAEKMLPEVKKKGYGDAWIITTKKSLQE